MKKWLAFIFIWLLTSAFLPGNIVLLDPSNPPINWLAAREGNQASPPLVETRQINSHSIEIKLTFSGIWASVIESENGIFTTLFMDGYGQTALHGQPDIPQYTFVSEIPTGGSVKISGIQYNSTSILLADRNLPTTIMPVQAQIPKTKIQPDWIPPDEKTYQISQFFPENIVNLLNPYQQRNHHIQPIQISPVLYHPVKGELQILREISFQLEWEVETSPSTIDLTRLQNSGFDELFSDSIDTFVSPEQDSINGYNAGDGYLIICPDIFLSDLQPFVVLKQSQGLQVTLTGLSEIGLNTKEGIKNYIQNAYDGWEKPPVYLLIVGDENYIPAWPFKSDYLPTHGKKTDLYYATMDGINDFVPDIFYGRLPARNSSQLQAMLNKAIAYTRNNGSESWVKKSAFISSCDSGNYTIPINTHNYVIDRYTTPLGYTGIYPANPQIGGDKLFCRTTEGVDINIDSQIITSINDQRSLLTYSGHGSKTSWSDGLVIINQDTVRALSENQINPLVSSFACETGDFANTTFPESFGETWMIQPFKGAIAFLGSADLSYWGQDDILERKFYDSLFSNPVDPPPIGQSVFAGLLAVKTIYPDLGQYYWETYNLLGDPSTLIWIGPRSPDFFLRLPENNVNICAGSETITSLDVDSPDGFSYPVTLSLNNLPSSVNGQFSFNPIIPPATSNITFSADSSATAGTYNMSLHGIGGNIQHDLFFQLKIDDSVPGPSTLLSPANLSVNQSLTPTFSWTADSRARGYQIQISSDENFTHIVIEENGLITPTFTPSNSFESHTTYYWRVKANNSCGENDFSPIFKFDTMAGPGDCEFASDTVTLYQNDFEANLSGWSTSNWFLDSGRYLSSNHAYFASAPAIVSDQSLISPVIKIPLESINTTLRFWHWRDLESNATNCLDGGILEYSGDRGIHWFPIPNDLFLSSPYDKFISSISANPLKGSYAWCQHVDWEKVVVDISSLAGVDASFRYRFGTDNSTATEGWYVDDFRVQTCQDNYTFSATCDPIEKSQFPGRTVTYPIQILNSARPDSYQISVSDNHWVVEKNLAITGILAYNEATTVYVTVHVPEMANSNETDSVNITITSQMENSKSEVFVLTTTAIEEFFQYLPLINQ
ncbi:MAG: C25 family cysteine peptidase [Anaerolineaceae bacterium]